MADLLYTKVVEAMEKEIRESDAIPGTPLPSERALAAKYHVSRNVIRQALACLAEKQMISLLPGQGAVITYYCDERFVEILKQSLISNQTLFLNLLEVREVLELAIIENCVKYMTDDALRELYGIWEQMEQDKKTRKIEHFLKGDELFHEQMAKLLPNPLFYQLLHIIFSFSSLRLFDLGRTMEGILEETQSEHLMILEGLRSRDVGQAQQAVRAQMHNIRRDFAILVAGENAERNR